MRDRAAKVSLVACTLAALVSGRGWAGEFRTFEDPIGTYVDNTAVIEVPGTAPPQVTSLADGATGFRADFSVPMERRNLPTHQGEAANQWISWGAAPRTEGSGNLGVVLSSMEETTVTLSFSRPVAVFGLELQPNALSVSEITADFQGSGGGGGTIRRSVRGYAGALLFAAQGGPFTTVTLSAPSPFAIARVRYAFTPPCGNGTVEEGEGCDDGNHVPGDGCRADCTVEVCGDGILDPGEGCDDGNDAAGDGCRADCTLEVCGDGIADPGEACDDGNRVPGDGCRADCTAEVCGDGITDPKEECDDANADDGDGCTQACRINFSPVCTAAIATPAVLAPPNHRLVPVSIDGVSDPDGDPVTITVTEVRQDEPTERLGDGDTCPDAEGIGSSAVSLRAERSERGDGRVYHVSFEAADGRGGHCAGSASVCAPTNRATAGCTDQGPLYDSSSCP